MTGGLVQPVLIAKGGTHTGTVWAAARASVAAYLEPLIGGDPVNSRWGDWLNASSGVVTVHLVRRGVLDRAMRWARGGGAQAYGVEFYRAAAAALEPMRAPDRPAFITKARQDHISLPREDDPFTSDTGPVVLVNQRLTTGRAAEEASRALWVWLDLLLVDAPEVVAEWLRDGMPMSVDTTATDDWLVTTSGETDDAVLLRDVSGTPAVMVAPHQQQHRCTGWCRPHTSRA